MERASLGIAWGSAALLSIRLYRNIPYIPFIPSLISKVMVLSKSAQIHHSFAIASITFTKSKAMQLLVVVV
jgi:hypothetical protein